MVERTQCHGSYNELDVPPTLVSFCIGVVDTKKVISNEFKKANSKVYMLKTKLDENYLPDFDDLKENYEIIHNLIENGKVLSVSSIRQHGLADSIFKASIGNKIGFKFTDNRCLFKPRFGCFLIEATEELAVEKLELIGNTIPEKEIVLFEGDRLDLEDLIKTWEEPLEKVFPTKCKNTENKKIENILYNWNNVGVGAPDDPLIKGLGFRV